MLDTRCALMSEPEGLDQREIFDAGGCILPSGRETIWIGSGRITRSPEPVDGKLSVYAPDFFLKDPMPWFIFEASKQVSQQELAATLRSRRKPGILWWKASAFESFCNDFEEIRGQIESSILVKAVPFIQRISSSFDTLHRDSALESAVIAGDSGALLPYGLWEENAGIIGATPELLFELESDRLGLTHLKTMALAGTRTPNAPSLLDDPKQMREHAIVVEGLVEQLSPYGEVIVGETVEKELPNLAHLFAPVSVIANRKVPFQEWVSALHPTAAIGAWPKKPGWHWLQNQPHANLRGRYGAPFGFISPDGKSQKCLVAIRNVQWTGSEARILAGSGIVAASKLETEWTELNAKLDSIQKALGL